MLAWLRLYPYTLLSPGCPTEMDFVRKAHSVRYLAGGPLSIPGWTLPVSLAPTALYPAALLIRLSEMMPILSVILDE